MSEKKATACIVLIPVLGDQLATSISSLDGADPACSILLMMEVADETTYVRHHKKKIAFILSAMRHHAERLRNLGWRVDYILLDDADNTGSFTGEVARAVDRYDPGRIVVTEAGEWRVAAMLDQWETLFGIPVEIRSDTRFLAGHAEFDAWADGRKGLTMEYFYREMRRQTGLLVDAEGRPEGGEWNYDKQNRKPAGNHAPIPRPISFRPDEITQSVIALVAERFPDHPGTIEGFDFAVTHDEAMRQRRRFLSEGLPHFGAYQDAMLSDEPYLWHSILSPYINIGLLDAVEVCERAADAYADGSAPLNSVEGYIRQIIGWREFMRGIYWRAGPDYVDRNYLDAKRALPDFYWNGQTDLNCLRQAIGETLSNAYAHHIQRLMITGNFAMLIGADPKQVHEWYLEVYADAYEWVELPNTLGMSQFGDGGMVGSKPYAASGSYINRMSDYCRGCRYDVKKRIGDDACPFNSLYWDFLARNATKLEHNSRLAMPYRNWNRMDAGDQQALRDRAASFLASLDGGDDAG